MKDISRLRVVPGLVLTLAATFPIAVSALAIHQHWSLPKSKIGILLAEYLLMLPLIVWAVYLRKHQRPEERKPLSTRPRVIATVLLYLAVLIPLASSLKLGRYQGDESAYLFEARCLQTGHLFAPQTTPIPANALQFSHHLIFKDRWGSKYPPGWPLVLAVATAFKMEWFLNPILGFVLLALTYWIGRSVFGKSEALAATVVLGGSAFMILNCLGFMSHVLSAILTALALIAFIRIVREPGRQRLWFMAMVASLIACEFVRPFTGIVIGSVLIVAWKLDRNRRSLLKMTGYLALFLGCSGACVLWQNYLMTGSPLLSAYRAYSLAHGTLNEVSLRPSDLVLSLTSKTPIRLIDTASVSFPFVFPLALFSVWYSRRNRIIWGIFADLCCARGRRVPRTTR
jgi:hypothetical protein